MQLGGARVVHRRRHTVRVPRLRGKRFGEAVHLVNRAGLRQEAPGFTGTTGNPNYSGRCIKVISQSPPPGTLVAPDSLASIVEGVCNRAITRGKRSGHH